MCWKSFLVVQLTLRNLQVFTWTRTISTMSKVYITVTYAKKIAYIGTFLCYKRPDEKMEYTTQILTRLGGSDFNFMIFYYPIVDWTKLQVPMVTAGKVQDKKPSFRERMQKSSSMQGAQVETELTDGRIEIAKARDGLLSPLRPPQLQRRILQGNAENVYAFKNNNFGQRQKRPSKVRTVPPGLDLLFFHINILWELWAPIH
ncbi:hypothetical protein PROFUN_03464 [Planoprotostelium fungivorum]|uniref:Uncharacterized protein n=1 Tax=Planoprotostelium fungivorum TaxID=1890364 RepID=A0A2P6MN70_9EUKA|nr:hypothetical protein PROFUN_03464 [Planoprotostelium fungivorum]